MLYGCCCPMALFMLWRIRHRGNQTHKHQATKTIQLRVILVYFFYSPLSPDSFQSILLCRVPVHQSCFLSYNNDDDGSQHHYHRHTLGHTYGSNTIQKYFISRLFAGGIKWNVTWCQPKIVSCRVLSNLQTVSEWIAFDSEVEEEWWQSRCCFTLMMDCSDGSLSD